MLNFLRQPQNFRQYSLKNLLAQLEQHYFKIILDTAFVEINA